MTDHNKLVEALKEMCDPPIPGSDVELLRKVIQKLPIEGGDVDIEALPVTKNGVYTAEEGKAYSPVTVNVSTNPKTITLMRSQITSLDPYEFLLTQEQFDVISSNTEIIIDATDLGIGSIRCFVAADSDGDTYSGSSLIPYGGSSGISSIRLATYLADSSTLKLFVRFQDVNHPDADIATITDVESRVAAVNKVIYVTIDSATEKPNMTAHQIYAARQDGKTVVLRVDVSGESFDALLCSCESNNCTFYRCDALNSSGWTGHGRIYTYSFVDTTDNQGGWVTNVDSSVCDIGSREELHTDRKDEIVWAINELVTKNAALEARIAALEGGGT